MTNLDDDAAGLQNGASDGQQQPSRSEFDALLGRMQILEQQYQQHQSPPAVNSGERRISWSMNIDDSVSSPPSSSPDNEEGHDAINNDDNIPQSSQRQRRRRSSIMRFIMSPQIRTQNNTVNRSLSAPTTSLEQNARRITLEEVEQQHDKFELPASTYTFFITEPVFSLPFFVGLITYGVCLACLSLALKDELDSGTDDNPYGIAEVTRTVRIAQYLGIIVGVLIDEEIPTGLELIGKAFEQKEKRDHRVFPRSKIFFSSIMRISIGAMFLTNLFFVIVQESNVLEIFFDMVALEFVESIDDICFELCRRGFFSRRLKEASNQDFVLHCSPDARKLRRRFNRFIKLMFFSSMIVLTVGLSYIVHQQTQGAYGCRSLIASFGDGEWEDAWVMMNEKCSVDSDCNNVNQKCYSGDGHCYEKRLLIYSHFNGYYNHDGNVNERPRYVEMNKESGAPFKSTIPAELSYCEEIESWVLHHPRIRTSLDYEEANECDWLLRSEETEQFSIEEVSNDFWYLWRGRIEDEYRVNINCAECANDADCNYFGKCIHQPGLDQRCECFPGHFGVFCENVVPCNTIRSEKDSNITLNIVKDPDKDGDNIDFVNVYGRPMYATRMQGKPFGLMRDGYPGETEQYFEVEHPYNGSEIVAPHKHNNPDDYSDDDFFEIHNQSVAFQQLMKNYTFLLKYTGRRWYGQIVDPSLSADSFKEEEYHAFWMNSFSGLGQEDNSTLIISEITSSVSPASVDFFEMRRRNKVFETGIHDYDYSQYGVLIPLVEIAGAGFFHCNRPE